MYRVYVCQQCKKSFYCKIEKRLKELGIRIQNSTVMESIPQKCDKCQGTVFNMHYTNEPQIQGELNLG